jgi:glycosyltransferase involved in cell wall biosynthesis
MDLHNPGAGGAERYCWELARRFARDGASVTWIASRFRGATQRETYDGIDTHRLGNPLTIHLLAARYIRKLPKFDLVIESIVSAPFFLAGTVATERICLFYHMPTFQILARKLGPLSPIAYAVQTVVFPAFYKRETVVTDGESARRELRQLGFLNVHVAEDGLEDTGVRSTKKNLVVVTGPLKPWKRIEHAILAFTYLDDSWRLNVLGKFQDETYRSQVEKVVERFGLRDRVSFLGYVPEGTKFQQYAEAKLTLITSEKEGWSLPGLESAAYGCVSVGYDVPGVRDALIKDVTSLLVPSGEVEQLGRALRRVGGDEVLWQRFSAAGVLHAGGHSWEATYLKFRRVVRQNAKNNG